MIVRNSSQLAAPQIVALEAERKTLVLAAEVLVALCP
jgi:hypothetical protein